MNTILFKNIPVILILIFIAFIICLLICIFIQKSKKIKQVEYDLNYLKVQFNRQNEFIKKSEAFSSEFKAVYHDFKNHLICINAMLCKGDCEEAKKYLSELYNLESHLKSNLIPTGNIVFDSILNEKNSLALKNNITFRYEIILPPVLNIGLTDLCVVMGNILDNAIEACMRIKKDVCEKIIELSVKFNNDYICICLKNSTDEELKKKTEVFKTSKKEDGIHGIGIKSVEAAVLKYDGNLCFQFSEGTFELNILMKNQLLEFNEPI